jgi:polyisoprenoid-binding protein YceI
MTTAEPGATAAPTTITGNYTLDPAHTRIGFSARHAMVSKVRGAFKEFEGAGYIDEEKPANSHFEVTIKVSSIDTGNADRDAHLRTNDFLAMDEYPEIKFATTEIEQVDDTHFNVTGDLGIRGTTKPVTIEFEYTGNTVDPWGNHRIGFEGGTTINRKDWGITWNFALEAGGVMVSDKVTLDFDIEALKAKAEEPAAAAEAPSA